MIDSGNIAPDSFQTNSNDNDAVANVASYVADPSVDQFGSSLSSNSYVAKSHMDLTIKDYLSRPKLMYSGTLTDYTTTPAVFTYAKDFLLAPDIKEKIKYHHLLRGTFQVKLVLTAAPYATGQIRLSHMYGTQGDYGPVILNTPFLISNLAQKSHVSVDLGSATSCMLSIPLHIREPYHRIEKPNIDELNKLNLFMYSMTQLQNSQSATTVTAHWKIYVSMVDVEIAVPIPTVSVSQSFAFSDESLGVPVLSYEETSYNVDENTVYFKGKLPKMDFSSEPIYPYTNQDLLTLPFETQAALFNTEYYGDDTIVQFLHDSNIFDEEDEIVNEPPPLDPPLTEEDHNFIINFEFTSENNEANNGVVSGPASVIAAGASLFEDIPFIGPFALATRIGASAVGEIAKLFGFSRPRDMSKPNYPHQPNFSVGIGEVRSKQVTTDPNQEVTVDARFLGDEGDSLSFQNTIMRPGFCYNKSWTQAMASGAKIFTIPVDPQLCFKYGSNPYYFSPTPLAYASMLFQAWRGSLVYNIVIPANRFVRGKMRIYWSTDSTPSALDVVTNNSLSVLIDLTQSIDIDITVPYMCETLYKDVAYFHDHNFDTSADRFINGFLHCVVEEPLIVNNSSWTAEILVHVRAGHDFELAIPTNQKITSTLFDNHVPSGDYENQNVKALGLTPAPFIDYDNRWFELTSSGLEGNDVNPLLSSDINLFPNYSVDGKPALIHIGERIPSLRPVLKRFSPLVMFDLTSSGTAREWINHFIPYLPQPRILTNQDDGSYAVSPYLNTPTNYLSRMFGGMRGTMRYAMTDDFNSPTNVYVQRSYGQDYSIVFLPFVNKYMQMYTSYFQQGSNIFRKASEPIVVDLPYQNAHWFYPTKREDVAAYTAGAPRQSPIKYGISFTQSIVDTSARETLFHQSVGEDFQFVLYNGPPIVCQHLIVVA